MEQVNPNALGAPAEGFGQTVSFAFDPRGEVPQQRPITSQPRGGSISGGSNPQAANPNAAFGSAPPLDPTGALLMKVGEEMLSKRMDEQRTVKFVEGMQQAMNGAAIKDVVESVPWYAKLFGDTPVIEGARAYTASTAVNESVAKQVGNMKSLEALSSADAAKHFSGVVNSALTGDSGTDAVIMKGMTEQLPALMKAQAKAHYGFGQRRAATAMSANMATGAAALQSYGELYADDKVSEEDMQVQSAAYVRSIAPPLDINEENYTKTLADNMKGMAMNGQFHAIDVLKRSGVMAALTIEQANSVEAATVAAATKNRDRYAFSFMREIAELKSDAAHPASGQTAHSIADRALAMNTKYQKLTGSPVGLFSSDQTADMVNGTFNAIKAEQLKAARASEVLAKHDATEADKAGAAALLDSSVRALIISGDFPALKLLPGVSSDMIDRTVLEMSAHDPVAGGNLLANAWIKGSYVNDVIKQQAQQPMRLAEGQEVPTDGWFQSVELFNKMKASTGGLPYAKSYFGDYAMPLQRASSMMGQQGINHPEIGRIFQSTMGGTQATRSEPMTKDERQDLLGKVAGMNSNALVRKFTGATKLRQDTLALISDAAAESTENWIGAGMSRTEAMAMGLADAASTGKLEIIGGFAISNMDGKKDGKVPAGLKELASTPLYSVAADKADAYFQGFMQDFKRIPTDGEIKIMRRGEVGGTTHFTVSRMYDGVPSTYSFTAAEWATYARGRNHTDTTPAAQGSWAFGPQITYGTSDAEGRDKALAYRAARERALEDIKANRPIKKQ